MNRLHFINNRFANNLLSFHSMEGDFYSQPTSDGHMWGYQVVYPYSLLLRPSAKVVETLSKDRTFRFYTGTIVGYNDFFSEPVIDERITAAMILGLEACKR